MTHKPSTFNPNHIFVDTNVLVGGYSGDARFKDYRLFFNVRVIKPERVRSIPQ